MEPVLPVRYWLWVNEKLLLDEIKLFRFTMSTSVYFLLFIAIYYGKAHFSIALPQKRLIRLIQGSRPIADGIEKIIKCTTSDWERIACSNTTEK